MCIRDSLYPVIITLSRRVIRFSDQVTKGNLEIVTVLGAAIAKRDSNTGSHNYRVTLYAIRLGEAVGTDKVDMRALILGAFLHDVGKIGIRDDILLKPTELNDEEVAIMHTHVQLGIGIIQTSEWLHATHDVIKYHHEKYDGSGYMKGLRGEEIPLEARIFAIVDVFDALTSSPVSYTHLDVYKRQEQHRVDHHHAHRSELGNQHWRCVQQNQPGLVDEH